MEVDLAATEAAMPVGRTRLRSSWDAYGPRRTMSGCLTSTTDRPRFSLQESGQM